MKPLVFLELNEVNFPFLLQYADKGLLVNFKNFLSKYGFSETTSEQEFIHLEPWIQWVTAHTGYSFEQHKVLRLGDIVKTDILQIWERLEQEKNLKVGAVSPMNAVNRLENPAFFIPDPWTETKVSGDFFTRALYGAIAQAVNDNASSRLTLRSAVILLAGWLRYARPANWFRYIGYAFNAKRKPWNKAMFLDLLLADLFVISWRRSKPDFASLFLNAGAHIQHHYMFSSSVYDGPNNNPEWYIKPGLDPVAEVYELYDHILKTVTEQLGDCRLMLGTGLHQDPYPKSTYYYRLKNHAAFLNRIGAPYETVTPLMSRDFIVSCRDEADAKETERLLLTARAADGEALFYVDNRGQNLFAMLIYSNEIGPGFRINAGNEFVDNFDQSVAFVAIKNGGHNGIGYFADSGEAANQASPQFPLREISDRIMAAFG